MNIPKELKYSKSHEWVEFEGEGTAIIGITDFAQEELGGLVFVNLPEVGEDIKVGESFADVESVKAVSDVFSPVTGVVAQVNAALIDDPAQINENPYDSWLIKVKDIKETEELLDADAYESFTEEQE